MRVYVFIATLLITTPAAARAINCDFRLWSQTVAEHNRAMPHESVPLPLDPATLITNFGSHDVLTRGLVANVVAALGQFPDASLVHQILEHQRGTAWNFNASRLAIIGVNQELATAVHAWLVTLAGLGPLDKSGWQTVAHAFNQTSLTQYLNVAAQAVLLDGSLAPFEGDVTALEALGHSSWLGELRARAMERKRDARSTPFGVPTDDSQFLASGAHAAAALGGSSFVDDLLADWTAANGEGLWRNIGSRFRSWLAKDARAFSGPTMLGDFLRLNAVLPRLLSKDAKRDVEKDLHRMAQRLSWSTAKLNIAKVYVAFVRARLARDEAEASALLDDLIGLTANEDTKTAEFLRIARRTLWQKSDLATYLREVTAVGHDFDTYGFLAPFFAPNPVLDPLNFRFLDAHTRPFVTTIVASTLARAGALPVDVALRARHAFRDNERHLRDIIQTSRLH